MPRLAAARPLRALFETRFGLRLLYCGRFPCRPDWKIESERLPGEMIGFFFLERNDCAAVVNGHRLALREGELMVLRGGDLLSMSHDPVRPITALSIALALEQGKVPNALLQRRFARRYAIRNPRQYVERFDAVLGALQSPIPLRDWSVAGAVLQFLVGVIEETGAPLSPQATPAEGAVDRVLHAQAWAGDRLDRVLGLEEWARAVGWHPVHFERVFKQETGLSPMRWLEARRMEAARQYLSTTGKSVAEVAEAVGYADPFYFSRVFRRHFGMPPLRYRRRGLGLGSSA